MPHPADPGSVEHMLTASMMDPAGANPVLVGPDFGAAAPAPYWIGATFGVLLGSAVLTGVVAWALHAHNPTRPKWGPALILGGSSAVVGLTRVAILQAASAQSTGMFGVEPV